MQERWAGEERTAEKERERRRSEVEEKEEEDKEEEDDDANEEDCVDVRRSLLQPRERCTHAMALARVVVMVVVVVGTWIRTVDLNVLQKK